MTDIRQVEQVWPSLVDVLFVPHAEAEYQQLVAVLDQLVDVVGEDESHPLASLMEVISVLIEGYEDEHIVEITEIESYGWKRSGLNRQMDMAAIEQELLEQIRKLDVDQQKQVL